LTPPALSAILLDLELRGGVEQLPGMRYIRHRPSR
jgi:DNA processing protein